MLHMKRVCGQLVGRHLNPSVATKKKPPVMTECEVKVRGRWLPCTIYEALTERDQLMRCKYCHGPVQALKESSNGARAHIEHLQRHPGCRFPVGTFSGVESEHPPRVEIRRSTIEGVATGDYVNALIVNF